MSTCSSTILLPSSHLPNDVVSNSWQYKSQLLLNRLPRHYQWSTSAVQGTRQHNSTDLRFSVKRYTVYSVRCKRYRVGILREVALVKSLPKFKYSENIVKTRLQDQRNFFMTSKPSVEIPHLSTR